MWQFNSPEIVFGDDALTRLADYSASRVFIVSDQNLTRLGFVDRVREQLLSSGAVCGLFVDIEPEPAIETVIRLTEEIKKFNPELVVALGGGSVIDAGKSAWFLYEHPELGLNEINIFTSHGASRTLLIAIPTTSGSGADVTPAVVLTDNESERKSVFYARELQPAVTIVDPTFALEMSPQITADTGLDVLSHAIEAFTCSWHNDFADGLSLKAVRLIFEYLPRAYVDGSDDEAREHVHNAATIAGLAIANSTIGLGHALAHAFGAVFPFPHGRLIGLLLPYSMEYTAIGTQSRYGELARLLQLPASNEIEGVQSLVKSLRQLVQKIEQPITIGQLGITRDRLRAKMPDLVAKTEADHHMLTTIRVPDEDDIARIFWCAYDGQVVDF